MGNPTGVGASSRVTREVCAVDNGGEMGRPEPMVALPENLDEELRRMREVPWIYFAAEPSGRVAKLPQDRDNLGEQHRGRCRSIDSRPMGATGSRNSPPGSILRARIGKSW